MSLKEIYKISPNHEAHISIKRLDDNILYANCMCFTQQVKHGVYMYVVYIRKWSSAHALGGVRGVA